MPRSEVTQQNSGHVSHAVALVREYCFSPVHFEHVDELEAPTVFEYVPAGQGVHDFLSVVPYVPAGQSVHEEAPSAEYSPAEHVAQELRDVPPVFELRVPAGHGVHVEALVAVVAVEYVPAGHDVQVVVA